MLPNTQYTGAGDSHYSSSDTGILIYLPGKPPSLLNQNLVWVDRDGNEELLAAPPRPYQNPRISPDENHIVVSAAIDGNIDIYIWDLNGKAPLKRITYDPAEDSFPLWTTDGKQIAFFSRRGGSAGIYLKNADNTGDVKLISTVSDIGASPSSWSADGKYLVIEEAISSKNSLSTISIEGDHEKKVLVEEEFIVANPHISQDGKWMAYFSQESGLSKIWIRSFPEMNGWHEISIGQEPKWSHDGKELFYRSGDIDGSPFMMAVAVKTEPDFEYGRPVKLFRDTYFGLRNHNWDISQDGKRFLMIKNVVSGDSTVEVPRKINFILNWFEELKERVPVE